jgi:small-conductance mechanosensitive channel
LISGQLSDSVFGVVSGILTALLTATLVFALIKLIYVAEEVILHRFQVDVRDNLRARQIHTQVRILRRLSIALIVFLGLGVVFFSFERFRELGTGILASAGIAGLVIGLAAQRTLSNLLAGIQIAITQPIRLDDVVIVENEWGRIEEITLTYVVVRIWDLRRLILPISYFIEKPFQNWTRVSADILGTVFIYVDYTVPVDAIREELTRILQNSPNWDKKVNIVQVTNASEKTVEVRALMSAADASMAWDLRCEVRECLIAFLKKSYPQALPRARVELDRRGSTNYGEIDGDATGG